MGGRSGRWALEHEVLDGGFDPLGVPLRYPESHCFARGHHLHSRVPNAMPLSGNTLNHLYRNHIGDLLAALSLDAPEIWVLSGVSNVKDAL